jgi:2-succinyl-5-enolpyruvyl-6-hydroxy-3-cyclohexene-1-carboxylate synthase
MIIQAINNIAAICAGHGIDRAVLSPGSRCAPLTLAFVRHPAIKTYTISDERSAAFVGMGMAQASKKPVVLVCTSGSAAYNYAPAVAEAFFQHIPLIVITADRPPEWIDQWDGQTIRQADIYGKHVKRSYQLPVDLHNPASKKYSERIMNEAILLANKYPQGPVHVNVPLREPFYPEAGENWHYEDISILKNETPLISPNPVSTQRIAEAIQSGKKIAFLLGQSDYPAEFITKLDALSQQLQIPIIADIISNGHPCRHAIRLGDAICMKLAEEEKKALAPDLLISFGKSIISKNLKLFLRQSGCLQMHVCPDMDYLSDPFSSLTELICSDEIALLDGMDNLIPCSQVYLNHWQQKEQEAQSKGASYFASQAFSEFKAIHDILKAMPANTHLHLANSMAVRYANFIGLDERSKVSVWANRGTSGIDGSNSTAMGHAMANPEANHLLITGDVAFFYDRNAFWHNYAYPNLKILLLNNGGGTIFGMIKGPREQHELGEYFETRQALHAEHLAREFGISYWQAHDSKSFEAAKGAFLADKQASLLEVSSSTKASQQAFEQFKQVLTNP